MQVEMEQYYLDPTKYYFTGGVLTSPFVPTIQPFAIVYEPNSETIWAVAQLGREGTSSASSSSTSYSSSSSLFSSGTSCQSLSHIPHFLSYSPSSSCSPLLLLYPSSIFFLFSLPSPCSSSSLFALPVPPPVPILVPVTRLLSLTLSLPSSYCSCLTLPHLILSRSCRGCMFHRSHSRQLHSSLQHSTRCTPHQSYSSSCESHFKHLFFSLGFFSYWLSLLHFNT
jgi:hypothetical protein